MVASRSSPRERLSSQSLQREVAWSVVAAFLLTGCQSLHSNFFSSSEKPHEFAVDLSVDDEDDPAEGSWATSKDVATAHADYGAVKSRPVSQQEPQSTPASEVISGHSFAPRRLTLRRPVPVEADTADEASNRVSAEIPRRNVNDEQTSLQTRQQSGEPDETRRKTDRGGFWPENSGMSAWRPNVIKPSDERGQSDSENGSASSRTRRAFTETDAEANLPSLKMTSTPAGIGGRSAELIAAPDSGKPPRPRTPAPDKKSTNDVASEDGTGQQKAESTSPQETEVTPEVPAADESVSEGVSEDEPGVLERLRGLYAPRPTDTEKLRRQMRKFSDPFGLLKERDEDAGPTSSIAEQNPESAADDIGATAQGSAESVAESGQTTPQQLLDSAIDQTETELENWPRTPSGRPDRLADWRHRQTDLRLMYLLAGREADSVRIIESLPEEEQEFWQSLMLAMISYRDGEQSEDFTERLAEALEHLRTAEKRLQPLAQLKIRRAAFCDRIDGFGQITEFPATDFDPGQRVLIYVDVRNFRTELTAQGRFRSEFAAVIEYQREGDDDITETIRLPQILDECDVERTDYFQSFELTIPALAGRYTARVRIRDQQSLQTAETDLEFTVRSQQSGQ